MVNKKAISGLTGILRIVTICFGLVLLVSFLILPIAYANNIALLIVLGVILFICFVFSAVWLIILLNRSTTETRLSKRIDWIGAAIAGILILLPAIPLLILAFVGSQLLLWIFLGGVWVHGLVYLGLAFFLFKKSKQDDDNVGDVNYGDIETVNHGDSVSNMNYGYNVSGVNYGENAGSVNNGDSVGNVKGDVSVNYGKPNE